jgi:fluoride ion exporter CrcB/FEX
MFRAMGTLARYELRGLVQARTSGTFPFGTLLVNLAGGGWIAFEKVRAILMEQKK